MMSAVLLNATLAGGLTVVSRRPNPWASTFPSEILTCVCGDRVSEVLVKFSGGGGHPAFGHRSGVSYEAAVYREVLHATPLPSPSFLGACETPSDMGLMIEYLGEGAGVDEHPSPHDAMRAAAHWIGAFHAWWDHHPAPSWLRCYDESYYVQWARRTSELAGDWHRRLPWLAPLCEAAVLIAAEMAAYPFTVIHGEFTPSNILIKDGLIKPVDWESCARGLGEIDLVSLTEGWPEETCAACREEYQGARWAGDPPAEYQRRLHLAWLYWHLRWLGEREDWLSNGVLKRADHLREIGKRLAIL